jgi:hypothetical protein
VCEHNITLLSLISLLLLCLYPILHILGNDVSPGEAKDLRDLLQCPHMSSLKELYLDDNELESEGAVFIAEGVKVRCADTMA